MGLCDEDLQRLEKVAHQIIAVEEKRLEAMLDQYQKEKFEEIKKTFLKAQEEAVEDYVQEMTKLKVMQDDGYPAELIEAAENSVKEQFEARTKFNRSILAKFGT